MAHKAPRKYIHPLTQTHLVDRRLAVLVSQSAGDFSCCRSVLVCDELFVHGGHFVLLSHGKKGVVAGMSRGSLCTGVGLTVDTVFYRIIRAVATGTHSEGSYSI